MSDEHAYLHSDITGCILKCAFRVYNKLGAGFYEKLYENALAIELGKQGYTVRQQWPISVSYDGIVIGEYFADMLVQDKVIVELKAISELANVHEIQLINYLRATGLNVGLLINFGDKIDHKRKYLKSSGFLSNGIPDDVNSPE
ncbi:MAG: GxxExxY protein [Bacillota bacterium]|nr:GxxExxY protein [Bacillota bacterium]